MIPKQGVVIWGRCRERERGICRKWDECDGVVCVGFDDEDGRFDRFALIGDREIEDDIVSGEIEEIKKRIVYCLYLFPTNQFSNFFKVPQNHLLFVEVFFVPGCGAGCCEVVVVWNGDRPTIEDEV